MSDWLYRAYKTHQIGRRTMGVSNLDILIGQGFLHLLRNTMMVFRPRTVDVMNPIVIAGLPRTGTTFLQRFLHRNGVGKGQTLIEQLLPSKGLQRCAKPFLPLLEKYSPTRHHNSKIHKTGLDEIETEMKNLKSFLYARFGQGINLDEDK